MKRNLTRTGATLAAILVSLSASNLPLTAEAGQRTSLFDGKTLEGWDILKCEAVVQDGCILIKAGNGVIQTQKKYGDFVVEFEWKPLRADNYDSGVYFRYSTIPEKQPWPARYQANLRKGDEGNLVGSKTGKSQGLIKADDWNSFKLTVRGATAGMEINGKPAWKVDDLEEVREGFVCLQAEVPGGGQCLFRNVYITDLGLELFDGKTLDGWEYVLADPQVKKEEVWSVEDGLLNCKGKPVGALIKGPAVTSFRFVVEYRWPPGVKPTNSGIFSRITTPWKPIPPCVECQLAHGSAGDIMGLQGRQVASGQPRFFSVSKHELAGDIAGVKKLGDFEKPPGEWNHVEVLARGPHYSVTINGQSANEVDGVEVIAGKVGLQSEGGPIQFRRATLTPLD